MVDKWKKWCYNYRMKIGFTGTQAGITPPQFDLLVEVLQELHEVTEAHHGDCIGADWEFSNIIDAIFGFGKIHCHPPEDNKKRAFARVDVMNKALPYIVRNHIIVDSTEILIACPKGPERKRGSGTWATIRYARKQKGIIIILWPDGKYDYED